jgi:hypothetical protein
MAVCLGLGRAGTGIGLSLLHGGGTGGFSGRVIFFDKDTAPRIVPNNNPVEKEMKPVKRMAFSM